MKRILFASIAAASMFIFGCQSQPTNTNANANSGKPTARSQDPAAFTKEDKAVVIVITGNSADPIVLVPDPITLRKGKNERVRWCVYNNLEDAVDKVTITDFAPSDPFDSHPPFETGLIVAGDSDCTGKGKAATLGTFKYKITVYRGVSQLYVKDPGVIITE